MSDDNPPEGLPRADGDEMYGGDGGRAWIRGPRGWLRRLERLGQAEVRIDQSPGPRVLPVYALARRLGLPGPNDPRRWRCRVLDQRWPRQRPEFQQSDVQVGQP